MDETERQKMLLPLARQTVDARESLETLAREHGVPEKDLKESVNVYRKAKEKLQREKERKDLIPGLAKMASSFRMEGRSLEAASEYQFTFPEIYRGALKGRAKVYRPDVVWFAGEPSEDTATVLFEIEDGTSPKHQMGGLAFANILALKYGRKLWFFAIVREGSEIASNSIALSRRYLGPMWALNASVIPSFQFQSVEESVRKALQTLREPLDFATR